MHSTAYGMAGKPCDGASLKSTLRGTTEIGALVVAPVQHTFLAHSIESANAPNPVLRELAPERVAYSGKAPRQSQRAV